MSAELWGDVFGEFLSLDWIFLLTGVTDTGLLLADVGLIAGDRVKGEATGEAFSRGEPLESLARGEAFTGLGMMW